MCKAEPQLRAGMEWGIVAPKRLSNRAVGLYREPHQPIQHPSPRNLVYFSKLENDLAVGVHIGSMLTSECVWRRFNAWPIYLDLSTIVGQWTVAGSAWLPDKRWWKILSARRHVQPVLAFHRWILFPTLGNGVRQRLWNTRLVSRRFFASFPNPFLGVSAIPSIITPIHTGTVAVVSWL